MIRSVLIPYLLVILAGHFAFFLGLVFVFPNHVTFQIPKKMSVGTIPGVRDFRSLFFL